MGMTAKDWGNIKYFKPDEFGKDPEKADLQLVLTINFMRESAGVPIYIHVCFDDSGHSRTSFHYKNPCHALDFHFKEIGGFTPLKQFIIISQFPFGAIGYYPHWNNPGWHVDMREVSTRVFWVRDQAGKYHYGWKGLASVLTKKV